MSRRYVQTIPIHSVSFNKLTRMMKMTEQQVAEFVKTFNERLITERKQTLEQVNEMLNQRDKQSAATSDGWHDFNKVERYLDSLIRVSSVEGHKVHEEINEAVKKLKEMAYQG